MNTKYIAYYRVSTTKQGLSGLGLQAQQAAVLNYIAPEKLLQSYTDIESGKNNNRIELLKAIESCKKNSAILVIAKLDRLSRNLNFISSLMDSKIKFVCCDMPEANEFTIHIFAALAQQERKMISERTSKALQAKKQQGVKLGTPENLTIEAIINSQKVRTEKSLSNENNKRSFALIQSQVKQGLSFNQIAKNLNLAGFLTANNKQFRAEQVKRIYNKYEK